MTERPGLLDRLRQHNAGRTVCIATPDEIERMIERMLNAYPRRHMSEIDILADDIERLRAEIAAATKPKRRRSVESYARTVMKTGVTITTPEGETISKSKGAEHEMSDDLRKLI